MEDKNSWNKPVSTPPKDESDLPDVEVTLQDGDVWMTQSEMATLFAASRQTIATHIQNIYDDGELDESSTQRTSVQTRKEGSRRITRSVNSYNLEMIVSLGYRINSKTAMLFRRWAIKQLREYANNGYVINEELVKTPDERFFNDLLERVREIRSSEKAFHRKIADVFATSIDYDPNSNIAKNFFSTVLNKFMYAVTGNTASDLIINRVDGNTQYMGMKYWKGESVTKSDAFIAKNYLEKSEIVHLNLLVEQFLSHAELTALEKRSMTMTKWEEKLNKFLEFNEEKVLEEFENKSMEKTKNKVEEEYRKFAGRTLKYEKL